MTEAETIDLIARARNGESEAFDLLVRGHHATVYRWALVIAADADDAEDLAQAVWIKAHRHIAGYRGEARFTTWLYRIVQHTAAEFGRKQRRRTVALKSWSEMAPRAEAVEPRDEVEGSQLIAQVRRHLDGLPPRQRQVFALADLEDRTTTEIADMLEIAEATVRVTLLHARRAIRSRMLAAHTPLSREHR